MEASCREFPERSRAALADRRLQRALRNIKTGFVEGRARAVERLPEFEELRRAARAIKDRTLADLDGHLLRFEERVKEAGGEVHWCRDAREACDAVLAICRAAGARTVTKSKSMISEEVGLNEHLARHGIRAVETDLGEYIVQLRNEPPSHILAPAIHLDRHQIRETFAERHAGLGVRGEGGAEGAGANDIGALLGEARSVLRRRFLEAEVGVTGANLLVAETGSAVIVTNEGNADLAQSLPRVHVVLASIEKVVPTVADAITILRVLARSATGQEFSAYTTFATGPRRKGDVDGPEAFHVVLLDNGRSRLLGSEFRDMLRCIRCAACLNHCPVYGAVGGHAYGWVYSGPMGAVLTPSLLGLEGARDLPFASTFCGRCESVCPMEIPLVRLMRRWRERAFASRLVPPVPRLLLRAWARVARHPRAYRRAADAGVHLLRALARGEGRIRRLPFAAAWSGGRDLPVPEGPTFLTQWAGTRGGGRG